MNHFQLGEMELFNLFVLVNFSAVMWFFFFFLGTGSNGR